MQVETMVIQPGWLPFLMTVVPLGNQQDHGSTERMEWIRTQVNHNTLQSAVYASIFHNLLGNKAFHGGLPDARLDNDKLRVVVFDEVSCCQYCYIV